MSRPAPPSMVSTPSEASVVCREQRVVAAAEFVNVGAAAVLHGLGIVAAVERVVLRAEIDKPVNAAVMGDRLAMFDDLDEVREDIAGGAKHDIAVDRTAIGDLLDNGGGAEDGDLSVDDAGIDDRMNAAVWRHSLPCPGRWHERRR